MNVLLSKSYGLDGPKWSANEIATELEHQRCISLCKSFRAKKASRRKIIENVDHSQVLDYL